jgi:hypothetical protein
MPFIQLQFRRDTSQNWRSSNPILASGEMGIEIDTQRFKIGDGCLNWINLPYGGIQGAGVPVGGTAGQVLAKVDSLNYNTEWVTPGEYSYSGNNYIDVTYPTTTSLFDRGTLPISVTSHLPPSYTVTLVSGSIRVSNSHVTNLNSWQLTLGPIYVQYASGNVSMTSWLGNQTWEYWSLPSGIIVNTAGVILINDSSFGNLSGNNSFSGLGNGSNQVMVRIVITPFFFD